jgi:hypothetical protein
MTILEFDLVVKLYMLLVMAMLASMIAPDMDKITTAETISSKGILAVKFNAEISSISSELNPAIFRFLEIVGIVKIIKVKVIITQRNADFVFVV